MFDSVHWKQPILAHGCPYPVWFRRDGLDAKFLVSSKSQKLRILIGDGTGSLAILPKVDLWSVEWRLEQGEHFSVRGVVVFTDQELSAAFGLIDYVDSKDPDTTWIMNQFGGNSAVAKKFLRWKEFLNIPGPGTGRAGDPNLSIKVNPEIQQAVGELLERRGV